MGAAEEVTSGGSLCDCVGSDWGGLCKSPVRFDEQGALAEGATPPIDAAFGAVLLIQEDFLVTCPRRQR